MIETMARSGKAIEQMIDTEGESGRLMIQAGWRSAKARLFWYAFQAAMPVVLFVGILLFWTFSESPARTLVAFMLIVVARSEERRVGKEGVSTVKARWSAY